MNLRSASSQQLAQEFQRRLEAGEPYAADPYRLLNKLPLSEVAPLADYFARALEVVGERISSLSHSTEDVSRVALALDAIHRFGLLWSHEVLQDRVHGVANRVLADATNTERYQLARKARRVIAHLAPKLDISQVSEFVRAESTETVATQDPFAELVLASPRQILLQDSYECPSIAEFEGAFSVAAEIAEMLVEKLSDPILDKDISLSSLLEGLNLAAVGLGLVIPELAVRISETPEWAVRHTSSLVESLSWVLAAGGVLHAESPYRFHNPLTLSGRSDFGEEYVSALPICWVLLGTLLNRNLPWSMLFEQERSTLCERAQQLLAKDESRGWSEPGRIALKLFMATTTTEARQDAALLQDISDRLIAFFRAYRAEGSSQPYYSDGIAVALASWLTSAPGGLLELPHSHHFGLLSRLALSGRARSPSLQTFLFRAAELS
jgi:hypothetical protein